MKEVFVFRNNCHYTLLAQKFYKKDNRKEGGLVKKVKKSKTYLPALKQYSFKRKMIDTLRGVVVEIVWYPK